MSRKKSFRSTSFRFTEIGSPVYFPPATGAGAGVGACTCEPATVEAAWLACWVARWCGVCRSGQFSPQNDAKADEGWFSSRGNEKWGAATLAALKDRDVWCGAAKLYLNAGRGSGSR